MDGQFKKVMISNRLYEKNHCEWSERNYQGYEYIERQKKLTKVHNELKSKLLPECWTCGKPGEHQEWRDALNQYEITCDECHRNEYPEQYDSSDDDEPQMTMDQDLEDLPQI